MAFPGVAEGLRMAHIHQTRNPQFLLNPIEGLSFHEDRHLYRYQGEWLQASISQVTDVDLKPAQRTAFEKYKHGPDGWAARGSAIHKCLSLHLLNEPQAYEDRWSPWVETLLTHKVFQNVTTLASEYSVCQRTDTESIGGTLDFLLAYEDDPSFRILGDRLFACFPLSLVLFFFRSHLEQNGQLLQSRIEALHHLFVGCLIV